MPVTEEFTGEVLNTSDRVALRELAELLTNVKADLAREWTRRLVETLPERFRTETVSIDLLVALNEAFLGLVFDRLREGDLQGLYRSFYDLNRQMIEGDMRQGPANRISLASLYTSARLALAVISERIQDDHPDWAAAYAKLSAQLMMVVGEAYSDSREDHLQRLYEQANVLSHELRSPLSRLFGYLELLRQGDYGSVSEQQEEVLDTLLRETDELLWLLTGTLDLSRLETGKVVLRVEEVDLTELFSDVALAVRGPRSQLSWEVASDVGIVRTDRVKLKQILTNLVRNAVRYGDGSPIELSARMTGAGRVQLRVTDHGPGIPAEEQQAIFRLFERGEAAHGSRDGYGIGLHVVSRIVALLGGTVGVESEVGTGSTFCLEIPSQS